MKYEIWAAELEFLTEYAERLANATAEERSAAFARFGDAAKKPIMSVDGNTAVIKIIGALSKNGPSPIAQFFGFEGTSYLAIAEAVTSAANDPSVESIRLLVDSPGGRVTGVDEAAIAIAAAAKVKPVLAENQGIIASAAYWLASQATQIISTSAVNLTGSIGVIATFMDVTDEGLAAMGMKRLHVVSDNAPNKTHDVTSEALLKEVKREVNATERVFFTRVANGRGITVEQVREKFGQGGVFLAQDPSGEMPDAISAGMIDGLVEGASITQSSAAVEMAPTVAEIKPTKTESKKMTLKELLASDSGAKAEYDAALKVAADTARDAVTAEYKARVETVQPFITSAEYLEAEDVHEAAMQVLTGDLDASFLKMTVKMHDKIKALGAVETAGNEGKKVPPTPAQGEPEAKDDYKELVAADKARLNGEVS